MVGRSLVLKLYLAMMLAIVATFALTLVAGRVLFDQDRREVAHMEGLEHANFLGREVEASLRGDRPDPTRLAELERGMHHRLAFVPWSQVGAYPPQLAVRKVVWDFTGKRPHGLRFWVRIDAGQRPVGALRASPILPGGGPHPPFILACTLALVMAVILIPMLRVGVVRPLRTMGAIAHRLGEGDLKTPVPVSRRDEFGALEAAFEALRLRIQDMLAQKERLLTDISHELRGPLSRMAIALPLARQSQPNSRYFAIMEAELGLMDSLIGELLALARGRSEIPAEQAPVELAQVVRELVAQRQVVLEGQEVDFALALEPAVVIGSERLLARALGNLVDNAIKYAGRPGRVAIATLRDGDQVVVRVTNDGPGIDPADLPHLFEPFFRPDSSRSRATGGVGLGLAIVRAIAEGHAGQVSLSSSAASTLAELRLPAAKGG